MSKNSHIEWTDHTWNPWYGCKKVSTGCSNCYMFRDQRRYGRDPNVVTKSKTRFNAPLKWKDPAKVFTCSWSDWFIEEADEWREEAWGIILATPHLTYQILTKRPERIPNVPLPSNVWLGVSVENQEQADKRLPELLKASASTKFLSVEPLIEKVSFEYKELNLIDWVIVGGESGPGARRMNPVWAKNIRDMCHTVETAFFMKQMGGVMDKKGKLADLPPDLRIREFPEGMRA